MPSWRPCSRASDERLLKLFVESQADPRLQAQAIAFEGARYNIGPVQRTINVPVLALAFLSPANQSRSRFTHASGGNAARFAGLAEPGNVWTLGFKEQASGTLVRGANDADLPSQGRAWVDRASGRVLATEHIARSVQVAAKVEVTYKPQPDLPVFVPTEMREQYHYLPSDTLITGAASYGHFRRFTITTDEKPKPVPTPTPGR